MGPQPKRQRSSRAKRKPPEPRHYRIPPEQRLVVPPAVAQDMAGERVATLEAEMRTVQRDVAEIRTRVDAIHEVIIEGRGFRAAMRSIGHVVLVAFGGLGGAALHKFWP